MKILFLYTEIADYFLAGCKELINKAADVHVVRWQVNQEAPFQFNYPNGLNVYDKNNYSGIRLLQLVDKINPDIIICSGWVDKDYLAVCKKYKNKAITILTLDNQWKGSLKQLFASIISPFYLKFRFNKCWVPGELQKKYARKLGFENENIIDGFYTCDFNLFQNQYLKNRIEKEKNFPKRFIFVGRYYEFKGIRDLWQAFIELHNESPNDWELWCLGTGTIDPIKHEKIKHFGFVQPKDLPHYIKETGVFVLPSHFEPWGVVVHEFASAGFPLICSNEVGAKTAFVEDAVNGYIYKAGDIQQLKSKMKLMMNESSEKLISMGLKSVEKAKKNTPEIWADKLIRMISK